MVDIFFGRPIRSARVEEPSKFVGGGCAEGLPYSLEIKVRAPSVMHTVSIHQIRSVLVILDGSKALLKARCARPSATRPSCSGAKSTRCGTSSTIQRSAATLRTGHSATRVQSAELKTVQRLLLARPAPGDGASQCPREC